MHIVFLMVTLRALSSIWEIASLEWVFSELCCISNIWGRVFHISQKWGLPIYSALPNLIYLHDVLYGSLGVIKFDIELVVPYFFENQLLLILKCLACYLGLPLIAIVACDMWWLAYFEEVVMYLSLGCTSPCWIYLGFAWGQTKV